jgi:hypothetical protein
MTSRPPSRLTNQTFRPEHGIRKADERCGGRFAGIRRECYAVRERTPVDILPSMFFNE